jgi:hypothetical protein
MFLQAQHAFANHLKTVSLCHLEFIERYKGGFMESIMFQQAQHDNVST